MASYDPNDPTSEGWSTQRAGEAPTYPPAPGGLPAAASDVRWVAGKDVIAGELVQHDGLLYMVDAPMTLPSVFTTAGLTPVGGGGGGGGTGSGVADTFRGDWVDGPYAKNEMVVRNKTLYVATKDALAGDDPAFVGAPVDIGGVGADSDVGPSVPGAWTGSIGNTYTRFDTSAPCQVSNIKFWSAPGSVIPGPVTAGIFSADRATKLVQGVSTLTNVAGALVIAMDDLLNLPAGSYNVWYTNGHHMGLQNRADASWDGIVTGVPNPNPMYTDDYGYMNNVNNFRLWAPPASDSAWVRVLKGV